MNRMEQTHISRGMLHDLFQEIEQLKARVRQLEMDLAVEKERYDDEMETQRLSLNEELGFNPNENEATVQELRQFRADRAQAAKAGSQ